MRSGTFLAVFVALASSVLILGPGATRGAPGAGGPRVPPGFEISTVAAVSGARSLAFLPDGDLLVGTTGSTVALVPGADGPGMPAATRTFVTIDDAPDAGVAYGDGSIDVATQHGVWRMPYVAGAEPAPSPRRIVALRSGAVAPHSDGDVHDTSSVAVAGGKLYAAAGSSCNACTEVDPTRAAIERTELDGSRPVRYAHDIRNAIGLGVDPATQAVWVDGAGQDALAEGHPYEFLDALTSHAPGADYGWPACEENRHAFTAGADCAGAVVPRVEFPAYSTLTGVAFYPAREVGADAFPAAYRGGAFVTAHGSWHVIDGHHVAPYVAFVPMVGDRPATAVNWHDPMTQWKPFVTGFQGAGDIRTGRPTGVAIGPAGSLFIADDAAGAIYRIRPTHGDRAETSRPNRKA